MTHVGYLVAGWGSAFLIIGIYTWVLIQRGNRLAKRVPVEKQRWMSARDEAERIGDA